MRKNGRRQLEKAPTHAGSPFGYLPNISNGPWRFFAFLPQTCTDIGRKAKGKSVLIHAICREDSPNEPKTSFSPVSRFWVKSGRKEAKELVLTGHQ